MNAPFVTAVGGIALISVVVVVVARLMRGRRAHPVVGFLVNVVAVAAMLYLADDTDGVESAIHGVAAFGFALNALSAGIGDA